MLAIGPALLFIPAPPVKVNGLALTVKK